MSSLPVQHYRSAGLPPEMAFEAWRGLMAPIYGITPPKPEAPPPGGAVTAYLVGDLIAAGAGASGPVFGALVGGYQVLLDALRAAVPTAGDVHVVNNGAAALAVGAGAMPLLVIMLVSATASLLAVAAIIPRSPRARPDRQRSAD